MDVAVVVIAPSVKKIVFQTKVVLIRFNCCPTSLLIKWSMNRIVRLRHRYTNLARQNSGPSGQEIYSNSKFQPSISYLIRFNQVQCVRSPAKTIFCQKWDLSEHKKMS